VTASLKKFFYACSSVYFTFSTIAIPLLLSDDSSGVEKGREGDRVYYYVFDKDLNATKNPVQ